MNNESNKEFEFNFEKLFQIRKEKGISQEKLAEIIGVSRQTIYMWETGQSLPDTKNFFELCNALNISPKYLSSDTNILENSLKNSKKIALKKYIIIFIVIIAIIYLVSFTRKLIIFRNINKKAQKYKNISNYSYILSDKNDKDTKIFYKDKLVKIEKGDNAIYIDYNSNLGYTYSKDTNELNKFDIEDGVFPNSNSLYNLYAVALNDSIITDLLYSLNPFVHITSTDVSYHIDLRETIIDIDKNSGLLERQENKSTRDIDFYRNDYSIILNKTTDEDVKIPNK